MQNPKNILYLQKFRGLQTSGENSAQESPRPKINQQQLKRLKNKFFSKSQSTIYNNNIQNNVKIIKIEGQGNKKKADLREDQIFKSQQELSERRSTGLDEIQRNQTAFYTQLFSQMQQQQQQYIQQQQQQFIQNPLQSCQIMQNQQQQQFEQQQSQIQSSLQQQQVQQQQNQVQSNSTWNLPVGNLIQEIQKNTRGSLLSRKYSKKQIEKQTIQSYLQLNQNNLNTEYFTTQPPKEFRQNYLQRNKSLPTNDQKDDFQNQNYQTQNNFSNGQFLSQEDRFKEGGQDAIRQKENISQMVSDDFQLYSKQQKNQKYISENNSTHIYFPVEEFQQKGYLGQGKNKLAGQMKIINLDQIQPIKEGSAPPIHSNTFLEFDQRVQMKNFKHNNFFQDVTKSQSKWWNNFKNNKRYNFLNLLSLSTTNNNNQTQIKNKFSNKLPLDELYKQLQNYNNNLSKKRATEPFLENQFNSQQEQPENKNIFSDKFNFDKFKAQRPTEDPTDTITGFKTQVLVYTKSQSSNLLNRKVLKRQLIENQEIQEIKTIQNQLKQPKSPEKSGSQKTIQQNQNIPNQKIYQIPQKFIDNQKNDLRPWSSVRKDSEDDQI